MERCRVSVTLSRKHVILSDASHTLWCDRTDGKLTAGNEFRKDSMSEYWDLGCVWGLIGKIRFFTDGDWKLVVVTQASHVGEMPMGGHVYCVDKIGVIPLTSISGVAPEIVGFELPESLERSFSGSSIGRPSSPTRGFKATNLGAPDRDRFKEREKVEKRLMEALQTMFNDSQSFYFCLDHDLTHSLQRQLDSPLAEEELPVWKRMDDRYFWNKWMSSELLDSESNDLELSSPWIFPLIQGYVEVRQIPVECEDTPNILQPGWSTLYREEREKLLQESMDLEQGRRLNRTGSGMGRRSSDGSAGVMEVELQDMANIRHRGSMNPMPNLREPYDTEDVLSGSEEGEEHSSNFTPVKFTSELDEQEKIVGKLREVPAVGVTTDGSIEGRSSSSDERETHSMCRDTNVPPESDLLPQVQAEELPHPSQSGEDKSDWWLGQEPEWSPMVVSHPLSYQSLQQPASHEPSSTDPCSKPETTQSTVTIPTKPAHRTPESADSALEPNILSTQSGTEPADTSEPQPPAHSKTAESAHTTEPLAQPTELLPDSLPLPLTPEPADLPPEPKSSPHKTVKSADMASKPTSLPQSRGAESAMDPDSLIQFSPVRGQDGVTSEPSGSLFYTSQEVADLDGVMIDMYHSPSPPEGGSAERPKGLPLSPEIIKSCVEEGFSIYSLPEDDASGTQQDSEKVPSFKLVIISRRSCHRAGTRYKRRGVDSEGHVANYVETELVLQCGSHVVSYVIVRGSVPVYWSQPGNKYRPLPIIEKTVDETQEAFKKHFESQLLYFKEIAAVNLVKQTGREKLVGDAFEQHVVIMDNPKLSYVAFDFHQSYKVNQNLALQNLLEGTSEFTKKFKYCWIDSAQSCGSLCRQEGVFRVNCMDCLDRTNVVESILAREILQTALQKLGMISFEEKLSGSMLVSYQEMWANNGDVISKQYAGTAAMKGDITRYGERRFTGLMKDGYNSAHRYYLNVFRDSYRQVLIDLMQGVNPFEAFQSLPRSMQGVDESDDGVPEPVLSNETAWSLVREEAIGEMIGVCQDELFPNHDDLPAAPSMELTSWVLMEAAGFSFLGDNKEEEPCVVIHSKAKAQLCVAKFKMDTKKVVCFLRIPMAQISQIVVGQLGTLIRNTKRLHMRVHYSLIQNANCYFTFTTASAIPISMEEERAILVSIAELLVSMQPTIIIQEQKISKKRSPPHLGIIHLLPPAISQSFPSLTVHGRGLGSNHRTETMSLENHKEEEPLSAPSSPKLKSPLHQKLSHSCDDLLSASSHSLNPHLPTIEVTAAGVEGRESPTFQLEESNDESDGLESELEMINTDTRQSSPFVEVEKPTEIEEEVVGSKKNDEDPNEGSKFSRLKGRIMRTVKSTGLLSKSPLMSGEESDVSKRTTPSPPPQGEESSRTAAGKQHIKTNSPGLWRKMRKTSNTTPSKSAEEGELKKEEARKKSKSRMIFI